MGSGNVRSLFLKLKPARILLFLKDDSQPWYPSKLARESGCSYVHAVNLLSALRSLGIVGVEKKGKQNLYKLSEKGAYLALSLDDFARKCDLAEQDAKKPKEQPPAQAPIPEKK